MFGSLLIARIRRYARICGKERGEALGHEWNQGKVIKEATCTDSGTIEYTCTRDSSHIKSEEIPAIGHDWDEGTVVKEASCTEEGITKFVCRNDSAHTKDEAVAKKPHSLTKVDEKEATATSEGNVEYWVCSECGQYFADAEATSILTAEQVKTEKLPWVDLEGISFSNAQMIIGAGETAKLTVNLPRQMRLTRRLRGKLRMNLF